LVTDTVQFLIQIRQFDCIGSAKLNSKTITWSPFYQQDVFDCNADNYNGRFLPSYSKTVPISVEIRLESKDFIVASTTRV